MYSTGVCCLCNSKQSGANRFNANKHQWLLHRDTKAIHFTGGLFTKHWLQIKMSCSQQWLTMSTKQNNKAHKTIIANRRVSHTVFALLINLLLLLLLLQTDGYLTVRFLHSIWALDKLVQKGWQTTSLASWRYQLFVYWQKSHIEPVKI